MAYKTAYATELDANVDTDLEEVGTLREHDGVIYQWVCAGTTGWTTGMALVESTPGTDTTLLPGTVGMRQPIAAVSQSTVTTLYYGWVIKRGKCSVYTEGCGQEDPLHGGAATTGHARVMPARGRGVTRLYARAGGAAGALASAELS
jgi:hypothetical protein